MTERKSRTTTINRQCSTHAPIVIFLLSSGILAPRACATIARYLPTLLLALICSPGPILEYCEHRAFSVLDRLRRWGRILREACHQRDTAFHELRSVCPQVNCLATDAVTPLPRRFTHDAHFLKRF